MCNGINRNNVSLDLMAKLIAVILQAANEEHTRLALISDSPHMMSCVCDCVACYCLLLISHVVCK